MNLNFEVLKRRIKFLKKVWVGSDYYLDAAKNKQENFKFCLKNDDYFLDMGDWKADALPFCCAIRELSGENTQSDIANEIIISLVHNEKFMIHISDKPAKGYDKFVKMGFKVKKQFMGRHNKMLTWLELDLTNYSFEQLMKDCGEEIK